MNLAAIKALDLSDPLAAKRHEFYIPDGLIYLDGNSLGPLPVAVREHLEQVLLKQWGTDLIQSWNTHGWVDLPQRVGAKIARIIGAEPDEVIAADSTSVNLFKVLLAALELCRGRRVIVSDIDNFPTDLYIAQGVSRLLGRYKLHLVRKDELEDALTEQTAVLMLTEVDYRTGYLYDMARLTKLAQERGALTIWDLAHSAGALPVHLNQHGVDFAVGCGYKYLNGGPGAPAFLFVARRHQPITTPFLCGWMGHKTPFAFMPEYVAAEDIRRLMVGTPGILSMSALDAALDVFADVDMDLVRQKSLWLTDLFIELMEPISKRYGLELATPTEHTHRGSQVSYRHHEGYAVMQALISHGVIGDFRAPDIMRFGFTPLYLRFVDVWKAVQRLDQVLRKELWKNPRFSQRANVT